MNIRTILTAAAALLLAGSLIACNGQKNDAADETGTSADTATGVEFSADSAMTYVQEQCSFGPRVPNSEAHRRCGDYIAAKFRSFGLDVTEQRATFTGWDGKRLDGRNIIAAYRPEEKERVIICAHWDSRPWADADPDSARHREPVMAANDGASGVAVLLETARKLAELKPAVGVDFICFDAEDYGAPYWGTAPEDGSDWCLGSQYWSAHPHKAGYTARYGILLDMVGGRDARFCHEGFSLQYAQDIVAKVWSAAETAGAADYFLNASGGYAVDDHKPMNEVAGIPTIDIIPYVPSAPSSFGATWHTTADTPDNIEPATLRAVGQTILQVLADETK